MIWEQFMNQCAHIIDLHSLPKVIHPSWLGRFSREWTFITHKEKKLADMKLDLVADMEVDKVADTEVDKVANMFKTKCIKPDMF